MRRLGRALWVVIWGIALLAPLGASADDQEVVDRLREHSPLDGRQAARLARSVHAKIVQAAAPVSAPGDPLRQQLGRALYGKPPANAMEEAKVRLHLYKGLTAKNLEALFPAGSEGICSRYFSLSPSQCRALVQAAHRGEVPAGKKQAVASKQPRPQASGGGGWVERKRRLAQQRQAQKQSSARAPTPQPRRAAAQRRAAAKPRYDSSKTREAYRKRREAYLARMRARIKGDKSKASSTRDAPSATKSEDERANKAAAAPKAAQAGNDAKSKSDKAGAAARRSKPTEEQELVDDLMSDLFGKKK